MPMLLLTADRIRCLQPRYRSVVCTETCPAGIELKAAFVGGGFSEYSSCMESRTLSRSRSARFAQSMTWGADVVIRSLPRYDHIKSVQ